LSEKLHRKIVKILSGDDTKVMKRTKRTFVIVKKEGIEFLRPKSHNAKGFFFGAIKRFFGGFVPFFYC
jgi:hypothetical protein